MKFDSQIRVSIPYWCDWKLHLCTSKRAFHFVSIPYWCDWKSCFQYHFETLFGFNSLLVRLEEGAAVAFNGGATGFNSLLVRLEVENEDWTSRSVSFQFLIGAIGRGVSSSPPVVLVVSIPYWCDWKEISKAGAKKVLMFQFLIGAIGSNILSELQKFEKRFNSLLVRLEVEIFL